MFAGKFPAGTGTFEGDGLQIDLGLVGFATTTLAFTPEGEIVFAFGDPFTRTRKCAAGFTRGIIGGKGKDLVFRKIHGAGLGNEDSGFWYCMYR